MSHWMTSGASRLRMKRGRANEANTRSFEKEVIVRASLNEQKQRNIVSSWESNHMGGSRPRAGPINKGKESNMISLKCVGWRVPSWSVSTPMKPIGIMALIELTGLNLENSLILRILTYAIQGSQLLTHASVNDGTPAFCDYERTQPSPKRGHQVHRILPTSSWHSKDETHQDRCGGGSEWVYL